MRRKIPVLCFFLFVLGYAASAAAVDRGFRVMAEDGSEPAPYLYKGSYAFLVGNGRYTNGWEPLSGAVEDIDDVSRALRRHGFEISRYKNLTREQFDQAFAEFVQTRGQDPDNRLLFYYAGHGHTEPMATGEELGYLVMVDAPLPDVDPVNFSLRSVDMQSLITQARMIKSKHVLFMFDSCFSGSILNTRALVRKPRSVSKYATEPVRQFITAGRANEAVPDRSYFKIAFVNMLEGRAEEPVKDGVLTGEELGWYMKNQVSMYNPGQHPQYGKIRDPQLDRGDFIFVLPKEPMDIEIRLRPASETAPVSVSAEPAEESRPTAPAVASPPPVQPSPPPVVETASLEPQKRLVPAATKKPAPEQSPLTSAEQQYLKMLKEGSSREQRVAAKRLYKIYPYDPEVLKTVNEVLLDEYNSDLNDKHHIDAMAWLCKLLARSQQNEYMSTVQRVMETTGSKKIRKHAAKAIKQFPAYREEQNEEQNGKADESLSDEV